LTQTFPAQGERHEPNPFSSSIHPIPRKKKKEKENRSQRQVVAKALKMLLGSLVIHSTKERYCGKLSCFRMPAFTYDPDRTAAVPDFEETRK
jgi:hypothetical protein